MIRLLKSAENTADSGHQGRDAPFGRQRGARWLRHSSICGAATYTASSFLVSAPLSASELRGLHQSILCAIGLVLVLCCGAATPANAQVGIAGGVTFSELGDIATDEQSASLKRVPGWHVHLWVNLPLGSFALRPGLRYMDAGRLFNPSNTSGFFTMPDPSEIGVDPDSGFPDASGSVSDDHFVTYVEIPIDVRYQYDLSFISPYALVGPVLRFTTDTNNQDRLRTLSMAAAVGVGLEIRMAGLRFYPEVKRVFGVSGFTNDEYEFADVVIRPDEQSLNTTMLSIGIGF